MSNPSVNVLLDQAEIDQLAALISKPAQGCQLSRFSVEVRPLLAEAPHRLKLILLSADDQILRIVAKPQTIYEYQQHCRFQTLLRGYPGARVPEPLGYAHGVGFMEYVPGPTLLEKLLQWRFGYEDTTTLLEHLQNVAKLQLYMAAQAQEAATITIRAFLEEQDAAYRFNTFFSNNVQERFGRLFHSVESAQILDRPFPRTLIHGDFAPRNFIVTPQKLVLVDFMSARSSLAIWDALYFYQELRHPDYFAIVPEAAEKFRAIYEAVTPVPLDDAIWMLMSMVHTRSMLRHAIQRNLQHFEHIIQHVAEE